MDFVVGLSRIPSGNNYVWVILDHLTKSAHFLLVTNTDTLGKLIHLYVKETIRLHKIPKVIIFYWDPKFTSHFWKSLQTALGTKPYHPQTNEQSEQTIQTLEDMLKACALEFKGSSKNHLLLVEFAYNINFQVLIQMAPYKTLYWDQVGKSKIIGPEMIQEMKEQVWIISYKLLES